MAAPDIVLRDVTKRYRDALAVDDLSLEIERGEFLTLLGPSGCGKTTTLNMIAGFIAPTAGTITIKGQPVTDLPPFERDTSMVFQSYALFPHMTVFDNVAFGLRMRKVDRSELRRRVGEALESVHLSGLEKRYPRELSGGQQQRVALARAIVTRPAVLLLDEPLSNLDLKLREAMRLELKALQRDLGITSVYVTHDQDEALAMSDRIAVMNRGRVEQVGKPEEVYDSPSTLFVATFVGDINLLRGTVESSDDEGLAVRLAGGTLVRTRPDRERQRGDAVTVAVRPEKCVLSVAGETEGANSLPARVVDTLVAGAEIRYRLALEGGEELVVAALNVDTSPRPSPGTGARVTLPQAHCRTFPAA
ncbi:MAG TPA: ABC transporter ATP-binding protein [Trueperaceae bacterium]|nr:ABC transporter ATP-binding protein [Trueperaceae bacterium]